MWQFADDFWLLWQFLDSFELRSFMDFRILTYTKVKKISAYGGIFNDDICIHHNVYWEKLTALSVVLQPSSLSHSSMSSYYKGL